jgi:hypothetical protein
LFYNQGMHPESPGLENELTKPKTLKDVEPIESPGSTVLKSKDEIPTYVEGPLVKAAKVLWDKGIGTVMSSANKKNAGEGRAYMSLDYKHLSAGNKEIVQKIGRVVLKKGQTDAYLEIPVTENTDVTEIEKKFTERAEQFERQEATWIPRYSDDDIRKMYRLPSSFEIKPQQLAGTLIHDPESGLYFLSQEHIQKAKERL